MLFAPADHAGFWAAYGGGEPGLHERSRAWAVPFGSLLLTVGLQDGDDGSIRIGRATLGRLVATVER